MTGPSTDKDSSPLLGLIERLLTAAAVAGATLYVTLNALYVRFYGNLGTKPEEVGLDRLAVLSRAGWLALVCFFVAGLILYVAGYLFIWQRMRERRAAERRDSGESQPEEERLATKRKVWRTALWTILGSVLALFAAYMTIAGGAAMDARAAAAMEGQTVHPLTLFGFPIADVRATPARITWLEDSTPPAHLSSPDLLYLGRSSNSVVVLSPDGGTILIPADMVAVTVNVIADAGE